MTMTMASFSRTLIIAAGLGLLLAAPATAQQAAKKDQGAEQPKAEANMPKVNGETVIAKVGNWPITTKDVELALEDIGPQLVEVPPKLRYQLVVRYLIERMLLAQQALREGLENSDEYKRRVRFYQSKALRDAYFFTKIAPKVTDAEVRKEYDAMAKKVKPVERVRARHILVSTKEEAEKVLAELKKGAKFEDLAKKYSKDGSKEFGGDLGYFTYDEMVPEFSKAVFALKVGEVSKPVKTDYGWHIIKLIDRKKVGMQPFDVVKVGLRNLLLRKRVQQKVADIAKTTKIEFYDPELKKIAAEVEKRLKELQEKQQGATGAGKAGSGKSK